MVNPFSVHKSRTIPFLTYYGTIRYTTSRNLPTLPSKTTTSNTMESPFTTPCAFPPTMTAWIIKPEGGPKDDCTTGVNHVSVPIRAFILFIALFVEISIGRIRAAFDLAESRAKASRLQSGQALDSSVANVKEATTAKNRSEISEKHEIRKQVWNETYQQDASRMMKIRALAKDAKDTLVLRRSRIHNKERPPSEERYVY